MPVTKANLFESIPRSIHGEWVERLAGRGNVRIERIITRALVSPPGFWYDQNDTEWVLLIQGGAKLLFDDDSLIELKPGDHIIIPPHARHRVEWTEPGKDTLWLTVFY